jgi:hypothetical protein
MQQTPLVSTDHKAFSSFTDVTPNKQCAQVPEEPIPPIFSQKQGTTVS